MEKKIGIMGGTFNPVHNGHLLLAESARELFSLDEIIFMPSGNSYMKDSRFVASAKHRIAMTELAISENPFFSLSKIETERKGPTYTFETLSELKSQNPANRYFFIMGADNLLILEKWKNADYILANCAIIAAARGDGTDAKIKERAAYLEKTYRADIRILPQRRIDISSSEIRRRLADGKTVRYMLPEKVLDYIQQNKLYREEGTT
ncbi:MAG: nicotinate-nucleotide adenylyltransferase [Clostridium sp.]|nr:nicotinate-nucleotide adenylyltransferase [Clostridium sp.]